MDEKINNFPLVSDVRPLSVVEETNDPHILSSWLNEWQEIKRVGASVEKKVKKILEKNESCGDWHFVSTPGNRIISDVSKAYEKTKGIIDEKTFLSCVKIGIKDFESKITSIYRKEGMTIKDSKKMFEIKFGDILENCTDRKKLTRKKTLTVL